MLIIEDAENIILIAQYEFRPLSEQKAALLSSHLGYETPVNRVMSLAEITHQHERTFEKENVRIGFRVHCTN